MIEVSVGSAKFENAYKAVVWRIDRIPDKSTSKLYGNIREGDSDDRKRIDREIGVMLHNKRYLIYVSQTCLEIFSYLYNESGITRKLV